MKTKRIIGIVIVIIMMTIGLVVGVKVIGERNPINPAKLEILEKEKQATVVQQKEGLQKEEAAPIQKKTAEEWDQEIRRWHEREIERRRPYVPKNIEEVEEAMEKGTLGVGEPSVADAAIVELGRARDSRGVPVLIELLKNYKTTNQEAVKDHLKQDWVSIDGILEHYNMKKLDVAKIAEEWVARPRKYAAEALGRIGDVSALPVLREAFEKDKSREVRATAAYAIFDVRLKEAGYDGARYPIVLEAIPALEKLLNDEDEIVRYYAALSFAQVRGISDTDKERALSIIRELSLNAKYELIRDFATDRLKKIEEKKGLFIK